MLHHTDQWRHNAKAAAAAAAAAECITMPSSHCWRRRYETVGSFVGRRWRCDLDSRRFKTAADE